jgi:hypothetical protein
MVPEGARLLSDATFVLHVPGLAFSAGLTAPRVRSRTKAPWRDAVPGLFTGAVLVAGERHLDAGFDAVQAMLANLGRGGALIIFSVDSAGNRINQRNEASCGGSHDVAFGTGRHGLTG